jgi:hypothetical protein
MTTMQRREGRQMKRWHASMILALFILGGCCPAKPPSPPASATPAAIDPLATEIVGKWKLVRAGGKPPMEQYIKSQIVEIAADGMWNSKIEAQLPGFGSPDTFSAKGTWTLSDGELSLKNAVANGIRVVGDGPATEKGKMRMESGRLIIEPDPFMAVKKRDAGPTAGEYERDH